MSYTLAVVVPVFVFFLVQVLCFWERREARSLGPLWVGWAAGGLVGGAVFGDARVPALVAVTWRWPWPGGAVASLGVLLIIFLWARWPRVETPLDATWMGLAVGSGAALVSGLGGFWGHGEGWLPVACLTVGALAGSLAAVSWVSASWWWRLVLAVLSLALAISSPWLWAWLAALVTFPGLLWLAGASLLLLASALGLWAEERVLGPQLAEEVAFGLLPPWVAERGPRFWRRFSRAWAERPDERKAMVRLVVRLAACKAYLARHGKHQSTAAVELGRLRERARRLFAPSAVGLES